MNILLFEDSLRENDTLISITDSRKIEHVISVLKLKAGDPVRIGKINGLRGTGIIEQISPEKLVIQTDLNETPPPPLPCTLILAMPRPKVFKRVLQSAVTMGVKKIYLIKTWRVDKNYFESPVIENERIIHQALLGLEQAGDTVMPEVRIRKYFKPFVEDEIPELVKTGKGIIAHPYSTARCPRDIEEHVLLAVGPEGGFIQYELDKFQDAGFTPVYLGERILRVEQAVPVLLSHLYY